jgi:uncharacterized SAM-binding protein YcdF (DUF218 family)
MYKLISYLLQPYSLLLLLLGLAIAYLWRTRSEKRRGLLGLAASFLILVVLSTPAVRYLALGSLEWQYPPQEERPEDAEAIVVLGGGTLAPDRGRERAELDATSLYRALHAARLYHQANPCLLLVTGGKPDPDVPGPAAADLMAELLRRDGVRSSDLLVEGNSRTTYENATESRKLLEPRGVNRIVLVTEAIHLPRAVLCFRKQGFEVFPSGCHYRATEFKTSLYQFLPAVEGISGCEAAGHEGVGLAWYWFAKRI